MATYPDRIPEDYEPTEADWEAHFRIEAWSRRMRHKFAVREGDFEVVLTSNEPPMIRTAHGEEPTTEEELDQIFANLSRHNPYHFIEDGTSFGW